MPAHLALTCQADHLVEHEASTVRAVCGQQRFKRFTPFLGFGGIDITDVFDDKLAALRAHDSQTAHMDDLADRVGGWMRILRPGEVNAVYLHAALSLYFSFK